MALMLIAVSIERIMQSCQLLINFYSDLEVDSSTYLQTFPPVASAHRKVNVFGYKCYELHTHLCVCEYVYASVVTRYEMKLLGDVNACTQSSKHEQVLFQHRYN